MTEDRISTAICLALSCFFVLTWKFSYLRSDQIGLLLKFYSCHHGTKINFPLNLNFKKLVPKRGVHFLVESHLLLCHRVQACATSHNSCQVEIQGVGARKSDSLQKVSRLRKWWPDVLKSCLNLQLISSLFYIREQGAGEGWGWEMATDLKYLDVSKGLRSVVDSLSLVRCLQTFHWCGWTMMFLSPWRSS